jgi:hypothetical protein
MSGIEFRFRVVFSRLMPGIPVWAFVGTQSAGKTARWLKTDEMGENFPDGIQASL